MLNVDRKHKGKKQKCQEIWIQIRKGLDTVKKYLIKNHPSQGPLESLRRLEW